MTYRIRKRFAFSASHVIASLPPSHPCSRVHGHNYEVELELASDELDEHGFVVDYRTLDVVKGLLDEELDHRHLNDVIGDPASAEHLATWLFARCRAVLPGPAAERLVAVAVSETPRAWAEHRP